MPSQPTYFLVTSPGYTATRWLARVLNSHPKIACNHSAGAEALVRDYTLCELRKLAEEKFGRRDLKSALQFLQEFAENHPGACAVGNVHRYSLTALQRNDELWPGETPRRVVNLIRHPVWWVASGSAQLRRMFLAVPVTRLRLRRQFWNRVALYRSLGVPFVMKPEDLAFCYLCCRMTHLARERRSLETVHLKMEQITVDTNIFADMFCQLTGLEPTDEYIDKVFAHRPLHRHNPAAHSTWRGQFEGWLPWKQRVFLYWLRWSGLLDAYADDYPELGELRLTDARCDQDAPHLTSLSTKTGVLKSGPPLGREQLDQAVARLPKVQATTLPFFSLDPALALVNRKLWSELASLKVVRQSRPSVISLGLSGGTPPLAEEQWWSGVGSGAAFVHPDMHDRSPAIIVRHSTGPVWYLNLKGAGIRRSDHCFVQRDGRYLAYQRTLNESLEKSVDILADRPGDEPLSHALVGGARLWAALMEVRNALGWHRLLYRTDGRRADTCVPVRITQYRELPSPDGEDRKVPTWDYFTNPRWMCETQLEQLLSDTPGCRGAKKRFRRLLRENVAELERDKALRQTVGGAYLLRMQPVIYEHLSRGKLRVGHLWRLFNDDDEMRRIVDELNCGFGAPAIASVLKRLMLEVYICNGYKLQFPNALQVRLSEASASRFAFLEALYQENRKRADSMMKDVGASAGRTLGALHGGGGHCWGWRVKQRDRDGNPLIDEDGLARRVGAPSGGATAPRNMTVCGELLDLSHLYNPAADPVHSFLRLLSPVLKRWVPWICPRQVAALQLCDLYLAENSVTQFAAIVQGKPDLIPLEAKEIRTLRIERRRLEVILKTDGKGPEQAAKLRDKMEALTKQIHQLRLEQPPYGANPALTAFHQSYQAYSSGKSTGTSRYRKSRSGIKFPVPTVAITPDRHH